MDKHLTYETACRVIAGGEGYTCGWIMDHYDGYVSSDPMRWLANKACDEEAAAEQTSIKINGDDAKVSAVSDTDSQPSVSETKGME